MHQLERESVPSSHTRGYPDWEHRRAGNLNLDRGRVRRWQAVIQIPKPHKGNSGLRWEDYKLGAAKRATSLYRFTALGDGDSNVADWLRAKAAAAAACNRD